MLGQGRETAGLGLALVLVVHAEGVMPELVDHAELAQRRFRRAPVNLREEDVPRVPESERVRERPGEVVLDPDVDVRIVGATGVDADPSELQLPVGRVVEQRGRFVENRLPALGLRFPVEEEHAQVEPSVSDLSRASGRSCRKKEERGGKKRNC